MLGEHYIVFEIKPKEEESPDNSLCMCVCVVDYSYTHIVIWFFVLLLVLECMVVVHFAKGTYRLYDKIQTSTVKM